MRSMTEGFQGSPERGTVARSATEQERDSGRPVILAARNAHKSLIYAAAVCDFDIEWLWPEPGSPLCACPVTPEALSARLDGMGEKPFCVFVTSPDYLGNVQDIRALAAACHAKGVPLLVDSAHGAYLKFLPESLHPLDLGADMCCDSAHKTLPVLTGGAYLHISRQADPRYAAGARDAMALFGSTSPSYLILQSLDLCNARLAGDFPRALARTCQRVASLKATLRAMGHRILEGEPAKLTLAGDGPALARALRAAGLECEYADGGHVVMMFSPDSPPSDYDRALAALSGVHPAEPPAEPPLPRPRRAMTIREAVFAPSERVPADRAAGRVCAAPAVACPPAVPVAVSGEIITREAARAAAHYGVTELLVVRERFYEM